MDTFITVKPEIEGAGDNDDFQIEVKVEEDPLEIKQEIADREAVPIDNYPHIAIKQDIDETGNECDFSQNADPLGHPIKMKYEIDDRAVPIDIYPQMAIKQETDETVNECGFSQNALIGHQQTHTGEDPYRCRYCDKAFANNTKLITHMSTHTAEKRYQCSQCGKAFSKNAFLISRLRRDTGEILYQCKRCDKAFMQSTTLTTPHKTNTKETPYLCHYCDMAFSNNSNLRTHMHTHTGEQLYQCSYCDKAFLEKGFLISHLGIHTGEKPYECSQCDKCFILRSNLVKHCNSNHPTEKSYQCIHCDKVFSNNGSFTIHLRTHSEENPYECNQCDKAFSQNSELISHLKTHTGEKPNQCSISSPSSPSQTVAGIRPRQEQDWKRNVAKKRRNQGQEYVSLTTGRTVPAKQIGPPCKCLKKCFDNIGETNLQVIFDNYWASGDHNLQTVYLQKHAILNDIKSKPHAIASRQRACSREYYVTVVDEPIQVCKQAFVSVHGITMSRLDTALTKVIMGKPLLDLRGKHDAHPHIDESRLRLAHCHIDNFPTVSTHSFKIEPNTKYLEPHIKNKKQLYNLYIEWIKDNYSGEEPIASHAYFDILNTNFPHLKFTKIRTDTGCDLQTKNAFLI